MVSHSHNPFSASQNVGNSLGTRPCVRQTALYRQRESGNAMKELMGMSHLAWDNDENVGAPANGRKMDARPPVVEREALRPYVAQRVSSVPARAGYPVAYAESRESPRGEVGAGWPVETYQQFQDRRSHAADTWDSEASCPAQVRTSTPSQGPRTEAVKETRDTSSTREVVGRGRGRGCDMDSAVGHGRGRAASRRSPNPGPPHTPSVRRSETASRAVPASPSPSCSSTPTCGRPTSGSAQRAGSAPTPKISSTRFDNMRVAPVFSGGSSRFAEAYAHGSLPCHIDHGTCKNRIAWDVPIEEVRDRREALLTLCVDGLRETRHPHATVARLAFTDLAIMDECQPLSDGSLRQIMSGLRLALLAESSSTQRGASPKVGTPLHRDGGVFESALEALRQVAQAEGSRLAPHLHLVLPPLGKRMFSKAYRERIHDILRDLAKYGGPAAAEIMRARGVSVGAR